MGFCVVVSILNGLLVLSSLISLKIRSSDRLYSLSLLRTLLYLPVLVAQYLFLSFGLGVSSAWTVMSSELLFALTWLFASQRLHAVTRSLEVEPRRLGLSEFLTGGAILGLVFLSRADDCLLRIDEGTLFIIPYTVPYFASLGVLLSMIVMVWRLEGFWRNAVPAQRWEHRFVTLGILLASCVFVWLASYRLTFFRLQRHHFLLAALFFGISWMMIAYAVGRHKLLSRRIFISRSVVYHSVAPVCFGLYLTFVGLLAFATRNLGWEFHEVLMWFLVGLGLLATVLYLSSGRLQKRVHFFISTNFYVNKHDYRKQWLALSAAFHGAYSTQDIVRGLGRILSDAIYTAEIRIWTRNADGSCHLGYPADREATASTEPPLQFPAEDPLYSYFQRHGCFSTEEAPRDRECNEVAEAWAPRMQAWGIVLLAPILTGGEILGMIGLGREYTGTRYWQDDFDLLQSVGSQTAIALQSVIQGEEVARLREKQAWDVLSTFVLHDVKNAAAMLSLVRQNAGEHLQDPEFQADMLDAIDNALKRMSKVQKHLGTLKGETTPRWEMVSLCPFLQDLRERLSQSLRGLVVEIQCPETVTLPTDPEWLQGILENLLLNSLEAGGEGTTVIIRVEPTPADRVRIELEDDGPGIPADLLPDRIFEPFQTTKPGGTGVGLWHVKTMVDRMSGTVYAGQGSQGGALIGLVFRESPENSE